MKTPILVLLTTAVVLLSTARSLIAAPSEILLVTLGGYQSCGSEAPEPAGIGMAAPLKKMITTLRSTAPRSEISYLISCFDNAAPPDDQAQYILSTNPQHVMFGNAKVLLNEIERMTDGKNDLAIFIIGHSYGGWLSMYLVKNLRLKSRVAGLFTIDPISPQCGTWQYLTGGVACHQAPTDLHNQRIRENTVLWHNIFQDQDGWLHSGKIREAVNTHLTFRGPHGDIDSDNRTWKLISQEVTQFVQQVGAAGS